MPDIYIVRSRGRGYIKPVTRIGQAWIVFHMRWRPSKGNLSVEADYIDELEEEITKYGITVEVR